MPAAEPKFSSLVTPPGVPESGDGLEGKRSSGGSKKKRHASRTSASEDVSGVRGSSKRSTAGDHHTGICQKVVKKTGLNLVEQAMMFPGKLRVREVDPKRIVYKDSASTRVVIDPRAKSYQGASRIVESLQSTIRKMQFTMKLTGLARASIVPEDNGEPSDDEEFEDESEDDNIVNSDDDVSSQAASMLGSRAGSRAGSSYAHSAVNSSVSRSLGNLSAKHHKRKAHISGWLSQYSGCTKGHGERLLNKIYLRRCQELKVNLNSGMRDMLLMAPPCFCSLQSVNLSNFLIGDRGVQGLWPLLRYARALRSLNLAGNGIRDTGTRHIIKVFESEFYQEKNNDLVGLLILDLSHNPITGAVAEELYRFYESRKDVVFLGMANTNVPNVKRQRLVRACLAKLAGSDHTVMLEAWRLAKGYHQFFDLELFLQCERIVEATHGTAIYDMFDQDIDGRGGRHVSWNNEEDTWSNGNDNDELDLDQDLDELDNWGDFENNSPPGVPSPPGEYVDTEFDRCTPGSPVSPRQNSSILTPSPQTKNPFAKNDTRSGSVASRRQKYDFVQRCRSR